MGGLLDWLFGTGKKTSGKKASSKQTISVITSTRPRKPHEQVLDRHFALQDEIRANYRKRDDAPEFLEKAIAACEQQIAMAEETAAAFRKDGFTPLPSHVGFMQLAIFREKQKDFEEAIRISKLAKKQRWAGDWQNRIERCQKKIKKQSK